MKTWHTFFLCALIFSSIVLLARTSFADTGKPAHLIEQIETKLEQTQNPEEKANLCMYLARHHIKMKQFDQALEQYDQALELNHQSWVHLERARLLIRMKLYEQAHADATAAGEENPNLAAQAAPIIKKTERYIQLVESMDNPETIVLDTDFNPDRKSRFDVAMELGLGPSSRAAIPINKKRSSSTKTAAASSSPKPRRS